MAKGEFIVSLDFELFWGVFDKKTISSYGQNVLGAREIIPKILDFFQKYGIHATWATVGCLFAEEKNELLEFIPSVKPQYENEELSMYKYLETVGENETVDPYHYGKSLLKLIKAVENQEIGTHTFSHYYCKEKGQTKEAFADDLNAAKNIAKNLGVDVVSLVLPRNQFTEESFLIAKECGFIAVRGNPAGKHYNTNKNIFARIIRKLDSYLGISGKKCYSRAELVQNGIVDVKASYFLYPYNRKLCFLEKLKVFCVKKQMRIAAKKGKVFHLWWHPHNMGVNKEKNLNQLESILKEYKKLQAKYGFESKNMGEISRELLNENSVALQ